MKTIGNNSIVVGLDGSPGSAAALEWGIEEAVRRSLPLHVLCARQGQASLGVGMIDAPELAATFARDAAAHAEALLEAASARAHEAWPALAVTVENSRGYAAARLVELSAHAETVVVGHSGHGSVIGTLMGSVTSQVVAHAECPVVVVREPGENPVVRRGIVVGVDGSAMSELALGYAFEQAASRRSDLEVVHAWWTTVPGGVMNDARMDQVTQEQLTLSESMVGWAEKFPDVEVHQQLPLGPAVVTLVQRSEYAELLVVGSRGLGGFRSLLLGSVSRGVLQQAKCPVAVVRARPEEGRHEGDAATP